MPLQYKIELRDSSLIVRIEEIGSKRILYLDTLKSLSRTEDLEAVNLLIKIHERAPRSSLSAELSFQTVEVKSEWALQLVSLLAKTGKLTFEKRLIQKDVQVGKLIWHGELHSEKMCTIQASFMCEGVERCLSACDKVFAGWALIDDRIVTFPAAVSRKWLDLFSQGPQVLEGVQKKRFLEEELPIVWKKMATEPPLEVFPELVLTDATGCFANLWMDYGKWGRVAFEDLDPHIGAKARLKKEEAAWQKDLLEAGYLCKIVGNSHYYCPKDKTQESLHLLLDLGWKVFCPKGRRILRQTQCVWNVAEEGGKIAIRSQVHFQSGEANLRTCVEAKGIWVELDGGALGLLDRAAFQVEGEWEGDVLLVQKNWLSALTPLFEKGRLELDAKLHQMIEGFKAEPHFELSLPGESFQAKLLPFQQKGLDWLSFLHKWGFSALLADEMGLGKTVQVLAFFSRHRTNLPILVVAPSSLLYHWRSEIQRFLPEAEVQIHAGGERNRDLTEFQGIVITSYAILRLDIELFSRREFEIIVLDESNAIKTKATQIAQAATRLKGRFKIALTGTPLENRPEELWSQFRFLMPDLLGTLSEYKSLGLEGLRRKIRPFICRRKKKDVEIDLPDKIEQITWVDMHEAQAALYEEFLQGLKRGLIQKIEAEGAQMHRMEILEAILRLRQICCDPRLLGYDVRGAKIDLLLEEVESGNKMLIFSQFTSMLHRIGEELTEQQKPYLYLDGTLSPQERAKVVESFQNNEEISLFLLSLKAGGVGLNLTAADYVILFDPWWNEAVEAQAIDRAHRIGQKKSVIAKRYLIPGSIEEKMLRLKEEKGKLAEHLVEGAELNWTEEDWLHLLT